VCLNVGCIPSKALLRSAELAHIVTKEAKQFGISGDATFDYGVAFDRSRKVSDGRVAGVHFLMRKNKITEIHGYGRFTDANTLSVELNDGGTETVTFDTASSLPAVALGWCLARRCHPTWSLMRN
jgi:dihydrolipoyl dehydrogenase